RAARVVKGGRRGVLATGDLMTREEIARCPVHQEYYRRWPECWHTLIAPVDFDGGLVVPTLQRGARYGDFAADAKQVLGAVAPHIARAARLRGLTGGATREDALADAFNSLPEGILVLDLLGRIRFANRAAEQI